MKKFELTSNKIVVNDRTLYQIKAMISFDGVKEGDLGGYVEKESNLSQSGNSWVTRNARVHGDARVCGDAKVYGNAVVAGGLFNKRG